MTIQELLDYVKKNHLEDVFNYNTSRGYKPFEIELRRFPNGKYYVSINDNCDGRQAIDCVGISEQEACSLCMKYLELHNSLRSRE